MAGLPGVREAHSNLLPDASNGEYPQGLTAYGASVRYPAPHPLE
jgi:hypothetical protein